ncbi:DGQHR domain-containing protein [Paraburkholderia tuberum]|nr:DGQHR domain-containing protein [Paraburkholderia tuberum]
MFHAPAAEIESWSTVPRLTPEDSTGIQRKRNDFKVRSIRSFLEQDQRNTIPTAIVVTLGAGAYNLQLTGEGSGLGTITLSEDSKNQIFVVDGQHRLYGIKLFSPDAAIPVVAILDATNEERAFQFIVINNKVSKVATDHIRALSINFGDQTSSPSLEQRLKSARLSLHRNVQLVGQADELADSPFQGMVSLPGKPNPENRPVVPAAIEAGVAYVQSKKFKQLPDDESAFDFFLAIWSDIKQQWPETFSGQSKLMNKVGVVTMTKYVTDEMIALSTYGGQAIDLGNAEDVCNAVVKILQLQTSQFWLRDWTITVSDTKTVRDQIEAALRTVQQNIRGGDPWDQEVTLLANDAAS